MTSVHSHESSSGGLTLLLASIALCAFTLAGCDRNVEPFVADEEPRAPDLARIFPEDNVGRGAGLGAPRPTGAPPDAGSRGGGMAPPAAGPAPGEVAGQASIRGTIRVSAELQSRLPQGAILFLVARRGEAAGGPPLAVLRVASPSFPLVFEIGPANLMIPGTRFEGEIRLVANLDGDGNAISKLPGDLSGRAAGLSLPGAQGIEIVLDTEL